MLVQYNPKLQFAPDFARSWQESADGRTWTFHTQPNAKWSDGKPLTAADAAWTFSTILKFQNGPDGQLGGHRRAHGERDRAERDHPRADLQAAGGQRAIPAPAGADPARARLGQVRDRQRQGADHVHQPGADRVRRPVHAGASTRRSRSSLFKRNPHFYGPKPHIDGLGLQFFGTYDAEITALKSGQLDGIEVVPPTSVGHAEERRAFVVRENPGNYFDDFIINSNPQQDASHRELLNPLLRQAFDYAIDRQAIVKTSLLGYGQPGSSIIPPATGHWYNPAVKPPPFNLAKASAAAGPGRLQDGAERRPDRGRSSDVLHR